MNININGFVKNNSHKILTVKVWLYAAFYRFSIRFIPMRLLRRYMGEEGMESSMEASAGDYRYARLVARQVARSAGNTPWESKCLVRALTARKLLWEKRIPTTLYLGIKKEEEEMIAHAWLRAGSLFVTGGKGEGYCVVARYRKQ